MTKNLLFVLATLFSLSVCAQVINGDLDKDNKLTKNDALLLVNDYVTNSQHSLMADQIYPSANSLIEGTWYETKTKSLTFNADGTTDYVQGYTYKCLPVPGKIVFYNAKGYTMAVLDIIDCTADKLILSERGSTTFKTYTKPQQLVTGITFFSTIISAKVDEDFVLTPTVTPSDAENKTLAWSSSDKSVVEVHESVLDESYGYVSVKGVGTAIITASATDGSGVKATCVVNVYAQHNNHAYVDLGTGVKWATMNIGASTPDDYGDYFAWGETSGYKSGKTTFDWSNYKWCNGTYYSQTKYCTNSVYGTVDNKTILDPEDDAAHVNWGGNWRMPTRAEQDALRSQCYWQWVTTYNGKSVNGYIVYKAKADADKGKKTNDYNNPSLVGSYSVSDPHIFLPAAGYRGNSSLLDAGSVGYYWSSSLLESDPISTYGLLFYSDGVDRDQYERRAGQSVRAVCP